MGKRFIWANNKKHKWHLSYKRAKSINLLFDKIENEKALKKGNAKISLNGKPLVGAGKPSEFDYSASNGNPIGGVR